MNSKVKITSLIIIFSIMLVFLSFPNNNINATLETKDFEIKFKDYTAQTPIIITHDDNFSLYPITGSGSALDPYRIENFNITSSTESTAISISHTTKHFIIKNCYLRPTTTGIYLNNVTQGTAQLVDNIIEGIAVSLGAGIFIKSTNSTFVANNTYLKPLVQCSAFQIQYAHHTEIFNNTALNLPGPSFTSFIPVYRSNSVIIANNTGNYCGFGITINECNNATIEHNSLSDCLNTAISLFKSPDSVINNNILEDCGFLALDLFDSPSNITNNIFINKGLRIANSDESLYRLYRVENNKVNGKDFGYFIDTPDLTIDSSIYSQIFALNCSNLIIDNFVTDDISFVINLQNCSSPSIANCKFSHSYYPAILLISCSSSEITDSLFSYCEQGLSIYKSNFTNVDHNVFIYQFMEALTVENSHNATITYNLFQQGGGGVELYFEATNTSIHHNTFQNCHAWDDGVDNIWYDPLTQEGNYWWDYSGTGNYTIPGSVRSNDTYPLLTPPIDIIPEFNLDSHFSLLLLLIPLFAVIPYIRKRKK